MNRIQAERITFIHPPSDEVHRVTGGSVLDDDGLVAVEIRSDGPRWEQPGMDVVAADADGKVIEAFTVGEIKMPAAGQKTNGVRKVYLAS